MKKTKKKIDKLESTMSRRTVLKTAVVGAAAAAFGFDLAFDIALLTSICIRSSAIFLFASLTLLDIIYH